MPECVRHSLSNGLRVILTPLPGATTVLTLVLVKSGSRAETKEKNGMAHFMEHMFFKGGRKYPNSMVLAEACDAVGAVHNAYTSQEVVGFFVEHGISAGNLGYDILEDMLLYARFPEETMGIERDIILGELRGAMDNDEEWLDVMAGKELLYGEHPLGREVLGTKETITGVRREDLIQYQDTFFKAGNIVISIAGNIDIQPTLREMENRFSTMSSGNVPKWQKFDAGRRPVERICLYPRKEKEQSHVLLIAPITGYSHDDKYALSALAALLGGSPSSRLFQEIREKNGLVYYIGSANDAHEEAGVLVSYWGVDHEEINVSIQLVFDEYKKIRNSAVSDEEICKVKGMLVGHYEIRLSRITALAREYANHELLLGHPVSLSEYKERVWAISKEDILCAAQKYLHPKNLKIAMTAQENYCDKEKLEQILEKAR